MKKVQILKADYDDLVYPALAMTSSENVSDLRTASKVLSKLEASGKHMPVPSRTATLCENCRVQFNASDTKPPAPMFELDGISAVFIFEDAEAEYLAQQLLAWIPRLPARQARNMIPIIDALEKEYDDVGVSESAKIAVVPED